MFRNVLCSAANGVARVTLNRPAKRNALNAELVAELRAALADASADADVKAVLIDGAGDDFCSGADLAELQDAAGRRVLDNMRDAQNMAELFRAMRTCPKPVVAAVRGRALAGGCGLATACDIVVAAESAKFGYPEVNIGFVPAMVMALVRRRVSEKAAFELVATGEAVGAGRAHELGLVQRVFPDATFAADATAYVDRLAAKPASAMMLTKRLLYQMDALGFDAALDAGVDVNVIGRMTDDCRDGIEKFLKKSS